MARARQGSAGASFWISVSSVRSGARGASANAPGVLAVADRAAGGGRRAAADRVREPGQPSARARRRAQARNRRCACRSAPAADASSASSSPRVWRWPRWAASRPSPSRTSLHGALVRMMAESDPDFHMSFALDPLVLAFVAGRDRRRRAVVRRASGLAGHQGRRRSQLSRNRVAARSARFGQMRSGRLLVSLQLALSLPLLVGAGLLARTVYNLQRADLGFPAERLLLVRVDLREAGYETARREQPASRAASDEIQRIPGVRAASFSQLGVFSGGESSATIDVEGLHAERRRRPRIGLRRRRSPATSRRWVFRSRWDATSWRAIAATPPGSA